MTDTRIKKLAHTIVHYSIELKPGETTVITGDLAGLPLIREIHKAAVEAGGLVIVRLADEAMDNYFIRHASDQQLTWISPLERWAVEECTCYVSVRSVSNTRSNTSVDPARLAKRAQARRELSKVQFARSATNEWRWNVTLFPTNAYAQEADMSLTEFEDFVYAATFADQPDPIQCWKDLATNQQKYVDWLVGRKHVRVRGPHAELDLSIEGRTFINSRGTHNMPSGEIFTGPVEDSVNGWVHFAFPAIREGHVVEGVELKFENGRIVDASAKKNEAYLLSQLDMDDGARYLGEFAVGTNYGITRFTGNILFDEKIGGTIHMAAGRGYPETGRKNESAIHWDFICDMREDSEIVVDGDLMYKNGQFVF
jgi:aminopeptidase